MVDLNFLSDICNIPSPDSREYAASKFFLDKCMEICTDAAKNYGDFKHSAIMDKIGNGIMKVGYGKTKIMVSAHIDEIGMLVQRIDDNGFIHFIENGGIDSKVLPGSVVAIMPSDDNESITMGVIGKKPIHLEWDSDDDEMKKVIPIKNLKIDCGFKSKEEAMEKVHVGDSIVMRGTQLRNGSRFISYGIDDKAGIAVVTDALFKLVNDNSFFDIINKATIYFVACVQEETGSAGAKAAAKEISPDISIDYDVTFATDDEYADKNQLGDIKLGKGGCIVYGRDKSFKLGRDLEKICINKKIPYQTFCINGGTNTSHIRDFSMAKDGCDTLLLSIPQRNMHTQVEVCDAADLNSLSRMAFELIKSFFTKDE